MSPRSVTNGCVTRCAASVHVDDRDQRARSAQHARLLPEPRRAVSRTPRSATIKSGVIAARSQAPRSGRTSPGFVSRIPTRIPSLSSYQMSPPDAIQHPAGPLKFSSSVKLLDTDPCPSIGMSIAVLPFVMPTIGRRGGGIHAVLAQPVAVVGQRISKGPNRFAWPARSSRRREPITFHFGPHQI